MSIEFFQRQNKQLNKLNVLTFPTHESYQSCLSKTGHEFYLLLGEGIKTWDNTYRPLPDNHHIIKTLPNNITFDLVLSQNKFGQFPVAHKIANQLQIPLISLEHTLPVPTWPKGHIKQLKQQRGNVNVFISNYSRGKWGWAEEEAVVITHGIDTELFTNKQLSRISQILSVVNDFRNRDIFCGFNFYQQATNGLPTFPVGATPGFSEPAKNTDELVKFYNESLIFVNTSLVSPVPTSLLEAMACGCCVVSTDTCMIPEVIEHNVNGYMCKNVSEMRFYLEKMLKNPELAMELGQKARQTIVDRFSVNDFVNNWNKLFYETVRTFR